MEEHVGPPPPPKVERRPRLKAWRWVGLTAVVAVPLVALGTPFAETVLRVAGIYLFLMVGFRLLGKRELGELSQFELVTLMLIPEIVSPALNRDDTTLTGAIVGVCALFAMVVLLSMLAHISPKAASVFEGHPAVLVRDGRLVVEELNRERLSPDELYSSMHQAGIERIEDVKWAILEPGGRIAFIARDAQGAGGSAEPGLIS